MLLCGLRIKRPAGQHANVHVWPKIARKESTVLASEVLGLYNDTAYQPYQP
jgi:hypothetical protein